MKFQGRIAKMLPIRSGVSQKTGNEWKAQPFVFEYFENPSDRYADSVVLETFNTDAMAWMKEGVEVICGFGHRAKEITRKDNGQTSYINEMNLYRFEKVGEQQAPTPATPPAEPTQEQKEAMEKLKNLGEQASTGDANGSDDELPF